MRWRVSVVTWDVSPKSRSFTESGLPVARRAAALACICESPGKMSIKSGDEASGLRNYKSKNKKPALSP